MWRLLLPKSNRMIKKVSPLAGLFFAQYSNLYSIMLIKKSENKNKPKSYKRIGAIGKISVKVLKQSIVLAG